MFLQYLKLIFLPHSVSEKFHHWKIKKRDDIPFNLISEYAFESLSPESNHCPSAKFILLFGLRQKPKFSIDVDRNPGIQLNKCLKIYAEIYYSVHDLRSPSLITGQEQAKNDRPSTSREKSKSINDEGERSSSSDVPRTPLKTSASTACHNNKKDDGVDSAPPVIENNGHLNNHLSPAAVMQQTTHLSNPPIAVVPS